MPVLWFYVCIQLLVHTARGQRGTGSQTGLLFLSCEGRLISWGQSKLLCSLISPAMSLLCPRRHNSFSNVTGGFSVVLEFHRVRGAAL